MTAFNPKHLMAGVALCGLLASGGASASDIEFIHTGVGSGTLNGVSFTNAAFTITDFADTTAQQSCGGSCLFIDDTSASISIAGLGPFSFVTATRTFVNGTLVGFSRAGTSGLDLFNGPDDPSLSGYALLTAIGPVSGTGSLLQWSDSPVVTSGGTLVFGNGSSATTFQAITSAVPEPSAWALMLTGVLGLGWMRRRSA